MSGEPRFPPRIALAPLDWVRMRPPPPLAYVQTESRPPWAFGAYPLPRKGYRGTVFPGRTEGRTQAMGRESDNEEGPTRETLSFAEFAMRGNVQPGSERALLMVAETGGGSKCTP